DAEDLPSLLAAALNNNPRLTRLRGEAQSAWNRVPQVTALPDPTVEADIFARPMMMGNGSQRAMLGVSQMIPSLKRLDAQGQEAAFEAMAREQLWRAEQLNLAAEVKGAYYRLYILGQQLRINEGNQELLEALVEVANARVRTGAATQ